MLKYTQHPLSAAFPAMSADEFQSLKDSITDLGVQNHITLYDGQVLDGWNRYCAATELGMECPTQELPDWVDPVEFVKAQNKHRRHLSQGAWALVEVTLYEWKPPYRPNKSAPGADFSKTTSELAASAGVSTRTVEQAKTVESKAVPAVKQAVLSGQTSLKAAEQIARLPADLQEQALAVATAPKPRAALPPAPESRALSPAPRLPAVKEEPAEDQRRVAGLQEETAALRDQLRDTQRDLDHYIRIVEQSDPLEEAVKVATEQRTLAQGLQARINSLMTEVAELKRQVSSWKRKAGAPA